MATHEYFHIATRHQAWRRLEYIMDHNCGVGPPGHSVRFAAAAPLARIPDGWITVTLIALWYYTSVICNQTSKLLVASLGSQALTLCPMLVAVGCVTS